jgi:hypothetical protein
LTQAPFEQLESLLQDERLHVPLAQEKNSGQSPSVVQVMGAQ